MSKRFSHDDYTVAWICALPMEMAVAKALLDEVHRSLPQPYTDQNSYMLGEISGRNVVVAALPSGSYGTTSIAIVASGILSSFPKIQYVLLVGIGAGVPSDKADIRLGDVVVGVPEDGKGSLLQYDLGKHDIHKTFKTTETFNGPPKALLNALLSIERDTFIHGSRLPEILKNALKRNSALSNVFGFPGYEKDLLFNASYTHVKPSLDCSECSRERLISRPPRPSNRPHVHYGLIASVNQIIKDGLFRDRLAKELNVLCFDSEAAGLMDSFPCLIVRGICDYADSHKNQHWQAYAALTAACFAKEVIYYLFRDGMQRARVNVEEDYAESYKSKGWQKSATAILAKLSEDFITQPPSDQSEMTVVDALVNSSTQYKSILEIRRAENILETRAQGKGQELNWRESVVDLLKLLDLDSSLRARSTLAEILDVYTGPLGSAKHNISLHQAVLLELARNGGELPSEMRNRLVSTDDLASRHTSFSDESEAESIFSNDSNASSESMLSQAANPALEVAYLLLKNATLSPLFGVAIANYDISKIRKRLKGLIFYYGLGLGSEASNAVQIVAAKFVQRAARQITIQITQAMVSEIKNDFVSNRSRINKLLKALPTQGGISSVSIEKSANRPEEPFSDSESDQSEPETGLPLQMLREVEQFMVESKAFIDLGKELRNWLGVRSDDIDTFVENEVLETRLSTFPEACDNDNTDWIVSPPVLSTSQQELAESLSKAETVSHINSQSTYSSFVGGMISKFALLEPIFWPRVPEGFKRIIWRSPLGKPLYIDVKERVAGAAERLQERFRASAQETPSASSSNSTEGIFPSGAFTMMPCAPPAAQLARNSSSQSAVSRYSYRRHDQTSPTVSDIPDQMDRKYLLLCFSTNKSEIFKQIDVTSFWNDQLLFENLHLVYRAIKREESWLSKIPLLRATETPSWLRWCLDDLHLYKPKKINFVSFHLMPLGETPTPFNIRTPSLPPQQEVHLKNWDYSPCPIEIEEWAISEALATTLLEPGHAFRNAEWLELFPKKIHPPFVYDPSSKSVLWGINIIEGLNKATVVLLALLVMLLSALVGLIYSLASHDVSAAFTLAAWFATSASLFISYLQFRS